ncbi:MAG: glycosyltransferase family 1 protein [Candidatus Bathyarchaeia archaeon]|nr:glycosyltransferase family 4 protein [Candidatus Jingweiarchaeum tengchongense]
MKIGVLACTDDRPAFETGVTSYQRVLFRMFGEFFKDIDFFVYLSPRNAIRYKDLKYNNIKYFVIEPPLLKGKIMRFRFLRSITMILTFLTPVRKVHKFCKFLKGIYGINIPYDNHLDILCYTSYGCNILAPVFIKTISNVPLISVIHDIRHVLSSNHSINDFLDDLYTRALLVNSDMIVVPSEFIKKTCLSHYNLPNRKLAVLYSIPDLFNNKKMEIPSFQSLKLKYGLPESFIFYPSTITSTKNHLRLIDALKIVKEKTGPLNLVLCGSISDSKLYTTILDKIRNNGLTEHYFHLGFISDEEKYSLYLKAKALVMPSINESFGLPIWEAFALGCPVIASNTEDLKEQVRDAALLCNPLDAADIAEKISLITSNETLRQSLIKKGYMVTKEHSLENYAKKWREVLSKFL